MMWYYVDAGQQAGPVTDEQLDELVRNGKVRGDTLVWREGQANWQPLAQSRPTGLQPPIPPPLTEGAPPVGTPGDQVVCAECRQIFPRASTIQYGNVWVCGNCKSNFVQRLQYGAPAPGAIGGIHYAGFWIRFVAKIIDQLILTVPILIMARLVFPEYWQPQSWLSFFSPGPFQYASALIVVIYNGLFLGISGATPGKMALGLKVVNPDGSKIGYGRAFGRSAAEILSRLICLIGYIIAGFDPQKRALHDHIASTRVIRAQL